MPRSSSLPLLKPCVHQYRIAIKNHPTQPLDSARLMLCPTPRVLRRLPQPQCWRQSLHRTRYQKSGGYVLDVEEQHFDHALTRHDIVTSGMRSEHTVPRQFDMLCLPGNPEIVTNLAWQTIDNPGPLIFKGSPIPLRKGTSPKKCTPLMPASQDGSRCARLVGRRSLWWIALAFGLTPTHAAL